MLNRCRKIIFLTVFVLPILIGQNVFAGTTDPVSGIWRVVDTVDYLNETVEYPDHAALIYSASGNSITHTNRNNAKQENIGSCSWSDPPASIEPGELMTLTLNANILNLDPKRIGTFGPTLSAYIDDSETKYKFKSGSAIDLKSSMGETTVKTLGKDGTIITGSSSLDVSAEMPDGREGLKIALMVSSSIGGGRKYVYEFSAANVPETPVIVEPPVMVTPEPVVEPASQKQFKLTGTVISMAFNPMRNMAINFKPSFGTGFETSTDSTGRYSYDILVPSETDNKFTIDMTLTFKYVRTDTAGLAESYFNIRDEQESMFDDVAVTTTLSFDLNAPEYKENELVEINRNVDFAYMPFGYISSAGGGVPDPLRSNLSKLIFIPGYTYVYDQLSSGLYTAFEVFKEKEMMLSGFPLIVYVNEPGTGVGYYNENRSQPQIHVSIEYSTFNDDTRYVILHEFGHFFESMTNEWKARCGWASKMRAASYLNHGGYLNSDTADSFIEGFATWYAVMVQRHGLYPIRNYTSLAYAGTLSGRRKPWNENDSEELCISSILTYLERDMTLEKLWPVLKVDRENFNAYYQALRATEYAQGNLERFNRYFKVFGIYKQLNGNGIYDAWELYREKGNNRTRDIDEIYADLMFDRSGRLNPGVDVNQVLGTLGQSSDALRNRDALPVPAVETVYMRPNSYLKITGVVSTSDLRVAVVPDGEMANAYVSSPRDGLLYLSLPDEPATGYVEVTVPGGGMLWTERIETLQDLYNQTR